MSTKLPPIVVGDSTVQHLDRVACVDEMYTFPGVTARAAAREVGHDPSHMWPDETEAKRTVMSFGTNDIGHGCTIRELITSIATCSKRAHVWILPANTPEAWVPKLMECEELAHMELDDTWCSDEGRVHVLEDSIHPDAYMLAQLTQSRGWSWSQRWATVCTDVCMSMMKDVLEWMPSKGWDAYMDITGLRRPRHDHPRDTPHSAARATESTGT